MRLNDLRTLVAFIICIGFLRLVFASKPQQIDDRAPRDEAQDYLDAFYGTAPDPTTSKIATIPTTPRIPTNTTSRARPSVSSKLLPSNTKLALTEFPTNFTLPINTSSSRSKDLKRKDHTDAFDLTKLEAGKDNKKKQNDTKPWSYAKLRAALLAVAGRRARPDDEVDLQYLNSTTTEITPYSDMLSFGRLAGINSKLGHYGNACIVYGEMIEKEQETGEQFEEDGRNNLTRYTRKQNDEYQESICKLSQRLECVRDRYIPDTTDEPGDEEEEEEAQVGTCRCIRALSDRAIYLTPDSINRNLRRGCYIPAGFSQSSRCGHIVPLPYGTIQTVGRNTRFPLKDIPISHRHIGNTSLMCVPNAECRTSSLYISRRCQCKTDSIWHFQNGTCEKIVSSVDRQNGCYKLLQSRTIFVINIVSIYLLHSESV